MAETASPENTPPATLGDYRLDGPLGQGGMGEVYRGHDTENDRPVALKRIKTDRDVSEQARGRFRREARALSRIHHPGVVEIYDQIESDEGDWLVMELVEGRSLAERLDEGPLTPRRAVEIARDMAAGLTAVHEHGLVHRDLKPSNVMLAAHGDAVKILDFGLAKRIVAADGKTLTETISKKGEILGTVRYMSPEQALGLAVDQRTDLFSLGVILYEMLTGVSPFAGSNEVETLSRICTQREIPVEEREASVPRPLARLIWWLLEKEPQRRPQTSGEVAEVLRGFADGMAAGSSESALLRLLPRLEQAVTADEPTLDGAAGETQAERVRTALLTQQVWNELAPLSGAQVRTLLLTDLVDSTRWVEQLGDERASGVFAEHDRMARALLRKTSGREIDKSDGFLMLFERPIDAVRFALGYHALLRDLSEAEGVEVRSRVGIHVGEVVLRANTPQDVLAGAKPLEVEGLAKAMAARFRSLAGGGQTLISRGVYDLARRAAVGAEDLPAELRFVEHGRYRMQGVEEPVEVFEVGAEGVAPLRPPTDSKKVKRLKEVSGRLSGWKLQAAGALAVVLFALAGFGVWQLWLLREVPPPLYVAVPPTAIEASAERAADLRLQAGAVRTGILNALQSYEGIAAVEPTAELSALADPKALAYALGAQEVLLSTLECSATLCQVVLEALDGGDGRARWSHRFTPSNNVLLDVSLEVADQVRGGYPAASLREGVADLQVLPEDYETFLRLADQIRARASLSSIDEWLAASTALHDSSPGFLGPYVLEINVLRKEFVQNRRQDHVDQAFALLDDALELAPRDPRILDAATHLYLNAGRLDDARQSFEAFRRAEPGSARVFMLRALLLEQEGDLEGAMAAMREAVRRQPAWFFHSTFANLALRAGDVDTARQQLDAWLELIPDDFEALSRTAQLELIEGSLERSAEFYERLLERHENDVDLTNLGLVYLLLRRHDDAARVFSRALEMTPTSPFALLNLADAELLRGAEEKATRLYEQVLAQIEQDPNPKPLLTVKAQALAHLGRFEEAIAAIQEAQRDAPDNTQILYESALVYVLVGEESSALVQARRVLEAGWGERWFNFTWFDPLRESLFQDSSEPGAPPTD